MIPFNIPPVIGTEMQYIEQAIANKKICGDGEFTKKCNQWIMDNTGVKKALLTTSCTHALEMAALLSEIQPGDEVIMPSYTFVSTADAFVLRGAKIVFVDIKPDTMNMDEECVANAITEKTKAIVPVHYAGVSCNMDAIMELAKAEKIYVIEDAAQGVSSTYKGKPLGTIGNFGCYSFHETKNYSMGEGGAILIRDEKDIESAEIIREKGTNRSKFFRGQIDKYTWVNQGSSYLPSELNAAYLYAQLEKERDIYSARMNCWNAYENLLKPLQCSGKLELPYIPKECSHNAHMFYIKANDLTERTKLINYLKQFDIFTAFHYVPLHSSPAGLKYGVMAGEDKFTTKESDRLLRLPLYYGLSIKEVEYVVDKIMKFYSV